jgi:hypothetical protein
LGLLYNAARIARSASVHCCHKWSESLPNLWVLGVRVSARTHQRSHHTHLPIDSGRHERRVAEAIAAIHIGSNAEKVSRLVVYFLETHNESWIPGWVMAKSQVRS